MSRPDQASIENRLLAQMSAEDFALLADHLQPVMLPKGFVMAEPDQVFEHVYFMERGIGSMITISPEGQQVEAGIFGREGFAPTAVVMGSDRTQHIHLCQVAGDGFRIERERLAEAAAKSATLRELLLKFVLTFNLQTSCTALSNAVHPVDERLARWLLMCHDRAEGDEIALTHEFMGIMLAVRRPSVTTSLHVLEGNGFVRSDRGVITIRDRAAMEEFAHDSYGRPEAEYRRLIGDMG